MSDHLFFDLAFTAIALPFCIAFGMVLSCPIHSLIIFTVMLLLHHIAQRMK